MKHIVIHLTLISSLFAIGQSAVQTLAFRYGAEGIALGEAGTAFSSELSSVFYNPANASFYGLRNDVNFSLSGDYESLLPSLEIDDIYHTSSTLGIFLPELIPDFTFSFVMNFNYLFFGEVPEYSPNGTIIPAQGNSYEWVYTALFSAAWKEYVSVGFSLKPFHSKLTEAAKTSGFAFDMGVRGQYPIERENGFYMIPGIGFSFLNMGDSVSYDSESSKDPIPTSFMGGLSFEIGLRDVIWGALIQDYYHEFPSHDMHGNFDGYYFTGGFQLGLTPLLQYNMGYLNDENGSRHEFHWGITAGYRHHQFNRFLRRLGLHYEPKMKSNLHLLYSFGQIRTTGKNDIRDEQIVHQVSLAFSIRALDKWGNSEKPSRKRVKNTIPIEVNDSEYYLDSNEVELGLE